MQIVLIFDGFANEGFYRCCQCVVSHIRACYEVFWEFYVRFIRIFGVTNKNVCRSELVLRSVSEDKP